MSLNYKYYKKVVYEYYDDMSDNDSRQCPLKQLFNNMIKLRNLYDFVSYEINNMLIRLMIPPNIKDNLKEVLDYIRVLLIDPLHPLGTDVVIIDKPELKVTVSIDYSTQNELKFELTIEYVIMLKRHHVKFNILAQNKAFNRKMKCSLKLLDLLYQSRHPLETNIFKYIDIQVTSDIDKNNMHRVVYYVPIIK